MAALFHGDDIHAQLRPDIQFFQALAHPRRRRGHFDDAAGIGKLAKLSFLIPNPPVPAVENAEQSASKTVIPPQSRRMNSIDVRTT